MTTTFALTLADAADVARALGRKFTDSDMTPALIDFASTWAADYDGDFPYLVEMRRSVERFGTLYPGKARGVLNCFRTRLPAPTDGVTPVGGLDLSALPAGRYAVPGGDTRLKVRIDRPKTGHWADWTFVRDAAEYGSGQRLGSARPGELYHGDIADELAAIVADPEAAMVAYGRLTSSCGKCGRPLEDADSVARGIGPVCARLFA